MRKAFAKLKMKKDGLFGEFPRKRAFEVAIEFL